MKGFILKHIIAFILVILSGTLLMDVAQRVQKVEREIKRSEREIVREEEAIRTLKAEWAYLNDPSRLEVLAVGGLGLASPEALKLVSDMYGDERANSNSSVFIPRPTKSPLHMDISFSSDGNGGSR